MRRKHWLRKSGLGLGLGVGGGGFSYYVRDQFITTRAVGDVHLTACEPGPGTRNVRDASGLMQIGSGNLICAAGAAVNGDPTLWFDAVTRAVGQMCVFQITGNGGAGAMYGAGGFATNVSAGYPRWNSTHGLWLSLANSDIKAESAGVEVTIGTTPSNGTPQKYCVITRAAGNYYFAKTGSFADEWTLLFISNTGTTATLYPFLQGYNGAFNSDFINVPKNVYFVPSVIIADTFSSAWPTTDGGGLSGIEAGGSGKTWISSVGTWSSAAGVASCSALDGGVGIATIETGKTDVYFTAKLTRTGGDNQGIVVNYHDANNYIRVYHNAADGKIYCETVIGGVPANIFAPSTKTFVDGKELIVSCRKLYNNTYDYFVIYNDVYVGHGAVSNATLRAATKCGLITTNIGNTFDSVYAYASGTDKEYAYISIFNSSKPDAIMVDGFSYLQQPYSSTEGENDFVTSLNSTGCSIEDLGLCSDGSHHIYGLKIGNITNPAIYIQGVQHGTEWVNGQIISKFMYYLANPSQSGPAASYFATLVENIYFYAIPIINPYGYINVSGENANGVNLVKNFPISWDYDSPAWSTGLKGDEPLSEIEAQIQYDKIITLNPIIWLNCHTFSGTYNESNLFITQYSANKIFWQDVYWRLVSANIPVSIYQDNEIYNFDINWGYLTPEYYEGVYLEVVRTDNYETIAKNQLTALLNICYAAMVSGKLVS